MYEQHTLKSENELDVFLLAIFRELSLFLQTILYEMSPSHYDMKCYTGIDYFTLLA